MAVHFTGFQQYLFTILGLMDSLIRLLPDNIANQIAAGEVIQRPASVIKELVENAVDAEASEIEVIIKDAGRTLIQVIDNGRGMEPMDARMAFERHATSKIRQAEDLFSLTTLGFRGEALPSIAAVSHVVLQTRVRDNAQGIKVALEGSKVVSNEPVVCAEGANFMVKHLFYNVPARRKFLKSDDTEFRHIISEVQNVAAVHPEIAFRLIHNDQQILKLDPTSPKQRILDLFGRRLEGQLLTVDMETPLVQIRGFVSKASASRKRGAQQYFFANERYMKHPYFHRMVTNAYSGLIPQGESPEYFLFFSVDPATIDVNISPTKTEIKFEREPDIASILYSSVREVLMVGAAIPTLDFSDSDERLRIPVAHSINNESLSEPPTISPIAEMKSKMNSSHQSIDTPETFAPDDFKMPDLSDWDKFYEAFESKRFSNKASQNPLPHLGEAKSKEAIEVDKLLVCRGYVVFQHPKGIAFIHLKRAQYKVQYEVYRSRLERGNIPSQRLLFPALIELNAKECQELKRISNDLGRLGFDISDMGHNTYTINALPGGIQAGGEELLLHQLMDESETSGKGSAEALSEVLLREITKFQVQQNSSTLSSEEEIKTLLEELFALPEYLLTPEGKKILTVITPKELEKRF